MIRLPADQRAERDHHKAAIRKIERPMKAAAKAARAVEKKATKRAVGKRAPGQREVRELDRGFLAYLRRLPCIAGLMTGGGCAGPIEAAHIRFSLHGKGRNPGMGRKNHDRCATPLCKSHHHSDQHKRSEVAFWADLGVDAYDLAADLYADYVAGGDGSAVLRRFTPKLKGAA